ncbi:MAG: hypothetical protein EOL87_19265, partial [Spartobacteria bacterium]|nr:hypothetical protein [Spartobacteria bacterium]
QNGGMNVGRLNAATSVTVGTTASETVRVTPQWVALPPLTNSQIQAIVSPQEGMLVYGSDSDVLLVFDGIWWKRLDGTNNHYLPSIPCTGTFTDIDGNSFHGVEIGDQCWMDRNLTVTSYPNGEVIPNITDNTDWAALADDNSADAYCYYNNSAGDYGALYSYAAAIADDWTRDNEDVINGEGAQGICPDGWHLPTDAEWTQLTDFLGGESVAGGKLKEAGLTHWVNPNSGATNASGFTALPGGSRDYDSGVVSFVGELGYWWSATENLIDHAWYRILNYNYAFVYGFTNNKSYGFSVRCVRDF